MPQTHPLMEKDLEQSYDNLGDLMAQEKSQFNIIMGGLQC